MKCYFFSFYCSILGHSLDGTGPATISWVLQPIPVSVIDCDDLIVCLLFTSTEFRWLELLCDVLSTLLYFTGLVWTIKSRLPAESHTLKTVTKCQCIIVCRPPGCGSELWFN